ncbi:MAG: pyridoxal 5'-phosphate synthase glutaminase subunit PdxT [Micromonosporaceae bacterium]
MLGEVGARAIPVRRTEELLQVDGLVIPGGESTAISKLAVDFELLEPIRKRIAEGMPAYGSCAGMIMLASEILDGRPDQQTFGGIEMTVRRNAFGRQVDSFETELQLDGAPGGPMHAVFIRAPWVESVGSSVRVLSRIDVGRTSRDHAWPGASDGPGRSGLSDGRIVAARQGNVLATAFHPELTGDLRVHRLFVEITRAAAGG